MAESSTPGPAAVEAEQVPAPWSDLGRPLLQLILSKVPQRHRLGHGSCCALVCSSWAEAAAAATDSIVLEQCADTDSLQVWLHRHGGNVTKLHVSAAYGMLTQLPCPKLRHLLLQGDSLIAAPALPATLAALPSLQHLNLGLSLDEGASLTTTLTASSTQIRPFPPGLLQQLPQEITHLELFGELSDAALQGLSNLTKCSHLVLRHVCDCNFLRQLFSPGQPLTGLQELQGLTCLHVSGKRLFVPFLPDFSRLKALHHLHLHNVSISAHAAQFQPRQLQSLTSLQHLHLGWMALQGRAAGGNELLAVLPHLSGLTYLGLEDINDLNSGPAAAFGNITSSTRLQQLKLRVFPSTTSNSNDVNCWQAMFPSNRQLPQLRTVDLRYVQHLADADLQACVSCCPNLQELVLEEGLMHRVRLHALLQLSGLTKLSVDV